MYSVHLFRLFHELGECFGDAELLQPGGLYALYPEAFELFSGIAAELGEAFWRSDLFLDTKNQAANRRGGRGGHRAVYHRHNKMKAGKPSWKPAERVMLYLKYLRNIFVHASGEEKLRIARSLPPPLLRAVRSGAIQALTTQLQRKMSPVPSGRAAVDPASAALGGSTRGPSTGARGLPSASASTSGCAGFGTSDRSRGRMCSRNACMPWAARASEVLGGGGHWALSCGSRYGGDFSVSTMTRRISALSTGSAAFSGAHAHASARRKKTLLVTVAIPRGVSGSSALGCW